MVVISFLLVIVAAVTLIIGLFQDGIQWIWASIASCVLAMIFLGIGVLQRRSAPAAAGQDEESEYAPDAISGLMGAESDERATEAPAAKEETEEVAVVPTRPPGAAAQPVEDEPEAEEAPATEEPAAKRAAKKATKKAATEPATKKAATKKAATKKATKKAAAKKAAAKKTTGAAARTRLAEIKGLGDAKVEALLKEFKSVEDVKAASVEELTQVKGIGEAIAERVRKEL